MSSNSHNYRFGPFELRTGEHRLLREGTFIPLPRKTYDVLLALVTSKGDVVSKEEFFRRVWPKTFIEEGSLTVNISLLRKILGDSSHTAKYIQTIPRVGYRLNVEVNEASTLRDWRAQSWMQWSLTRHGKLYWIIFISVIAVLGAGGGLAWHYNDLRQISDRRMTKGKREVLSEMLVLSEVEGLVDTIHGEMERQLAAPREHDAWLKPVRSETLLSEEMNRFAALSISKEGEGANLITKVREFVESTSTEDSYTTVGEKKFSEAHVLIERLKHSVRDSTLTSTE